MKVGEILNAYSGMNQLQAATKDAEEAAEKIASGENINKASDDPSGVVITEQMKAQLGELQKKAQNISIQIQRDQTAQGAYAGVEENLQDISELLAQAQNDTLTSEDKAIIQQQIDQLVEGVEDIVTGSQFNGQNVLPSDLTTQLGIDTITVNDADTGSEVIAQAIDTVSSERATFGSAIEAKEARLEVIEQAEQNITEALSNRNDTDMAAATTDLNSANTQAQVTTYAIEQKNDIGMSVLAGVLGIDEYA